PIGFAGGLNRYAYASGDPVNNTDASGLYHSTTGYNPFTGIATVRVFADPGDLVNVFDFSFAFVPIFSQWGGEIVASYNYRPREAGFWEQVQNFLRNFDLGNTAPIEGAIEDSGRLGLVRIHMGQQGKHIPGHNNYRPGKSALTAPNPQELI